MYPSTVPGAALVVGLAEGGWHEQRMATLNNVMQGIQTTANMTTMAVQVTTDTPANAFQPPAFPTQIEQVEEAVLWAKANAAAFNANAADTTLLGGSAGGHLAVMTTFKMNKAHGATYIRGVAGLSCPLNLKALVPQALAGEFNILSLHYALNRTIKQFETEPNEPALKLLEEQSSPFYNIDPPTAPKIWLATSEVDGLVPPAQTNEMVTALEAAGVPVTKKVHAGGGHAFAYWASVKAEVIAFLQAA